MIPTPVEWLIAVAVTAPIAAAVYYVAHTRETTQARSRARRAKDN
jgi:hypothetical protein